MEEQTCEVQNLRFEVEQICGECDRLKTENLELKKMVQDRSPIIEDLEYERDWVKDHLTKVKHGEHKHAEAAAQLQDEIERLDTALAGDRNYL